MSSINTMSTPLSPGDISRIIGRLTTAIGEIAQLLLDAVMPHRSSTQEAETQVYMSAIVNGFVRVLVQGTNNENENSSPLQRLYTMLQQDQTVAPATPSDVRVSDARLLVIVDRAERWRDLVQTVAFGTSEDLEAAFSALNLDEQS